MSKPSLNEEFHAGARHFCDLVRPLMNPDNRNRLLVAGCGTAHEAVYIRNHLDVELTGVDVEPQWDPSTVIGLPNFQLLEGSILDLPFPDDSFEIVFYHHVIEHVSDPARSLDELVRVLVPGGLIYVGTPNRHRAVGYLGSHTATVREKIRWNLLDYKARLQNRFRNEYGAHAGFTENELSGLMRARFADVHFLTSDYIRFKYRKKLPAPVLNTLSSQPLMELAAAAVYVVGRKPFPTKSNHGQT